uniref:(California timema) hypothetical protein n=1 Tax=Timema californicum TaxID=61474 RepID=A0A7R9P7R2_TIMCA|nr:unnamed protein product [Timema californicum]
MVSVWGNSPVRENYLRHQPGIEPGTPRFVVRCAHHYIFGPVTLQFVIVQSDRDRQAVDLDLRIVGFRDWSPGGAPQQQLSVVTTVWGVTTSTQSGPHGGNVAAGAGYGQQQGPPNKQGTPFASVGYRQGAPPGLSFTPSVDVSAAYVTVGTKYDALHNTPFSVANFILSSDSTWT